MAQQRVGVLWMIFSVSFCQIAVGQQSFRTSDEDLHKFVSRPDLRPPKFTIDYVDAGKISPGYWFVAPYADNAHRRPTTIYEPHQIGPHIYSNNGQLIWSGAEVLPTRSAFDFKLSSHNGEDNPTFMVGENEAETDEITGVGVVMDSSFRVRQRVHVPIGSRQMNMHEFTLLPGGKTALAITNMLRFYESTNPPFKGRINDLAFMEIDVTSGKTLFSWWVSDHIHPLGERGGKDVAASEMAFTGGAWDFFHLNSVDKDKNGDYLISGRHVSTLYKISGTDGSILWRLGGPNSSFAQEGFNFSSQHHARFVSTEKDTTTITILDNASNARLSNGGVHTANTSSALTVLLDTSKWTATLVQRLERPDGNLTHLRGSTQKLPNGGTFVCWSENSYITEFTPSGELALSARFQSKRLATYRAYKFAFTGVPERDPDLTCSVYGVSEETSTTVCHVSWNGATEVHSWRFWGTDAERRFRKYLGLADREGFETPFMARGYAGFVFAEAVDRKGRNLRNSTVVETLVPRGAGFSAVVEKEQQVELVEAVELEEQQRGSEWLLNLESVHLTFNQRGACYKIAFVPLLFLCTLLAVGVVSVAVCGVRCFSVLLGRERNKLQL